MSKKCIECTDPIVGRIDKKFCSDMCRNSYNNKLNSVNNSYVRNVNTILKRNRKILEDLVPMESSSITRFKLLQKGFNFYYFTNVYRTTLGEDYFFCYDYGYFAFGEEQFILIKRDEKEH